MYRRRVTASGRVRIAMSCRASSRRHPGACHAAGRIWPSSSSSGWASTSSTRSRAARPTAASRTRSRTASGSCGRRARSALSSSRPFSASSTPRRFSSRSRRTRTGSRSSRSSGATLLWVYFRHHERFAGFRNWLIAANLVGLVGYVLMPTAPPRMFPEWGFVDTLGQFSSINHDSGLIAFAANPYAAMPSLHSMDALIVGDRDVRRRALEAREGALARCGRSGSGSRSWRPATTTGSTSSPGFVLAIVTGLVLSRTRLLRPRPA